MNTGTTRIHTWKNNITDAATATIGWLVGPQANVEPRQQRRLQLLSALMVVMGLMTLSGAILLRNVSTSFWTVMLIASLVLFIGYFISRTKYHQAALILALTVPAINPLAVFLFELPEINLLATLMWLSLPLLVASLMMTARKTLLIALGYIVYITLLAFLGPIHHSISVPLVAYILIIAFFVTTISVVREKDQIEMAKELKEREQAEKALRESENKFRNLFENAKDAILLADTETGILLDVNMAGCKMLGLPKEKIIGKHQSEIHPPDLADKYKQVFQDHIQKGTVIDEDIVVQRADGVQIPIDISTNLLELEDKTIIQGTFRDMTERVRMDKAIHESEEKFLKAFRMSPLEVCITRVKDGKILDVNDSLCRNSGFTREEAIGHTSSELGLWAKPEDRQRMLKLLKKDGRVHNAEFESRNKNGEIRTSLFNSEPITIDGEECTISIMADITERKKMEKAIRESEEKLSKAFRMSPQEVCITRTKDGKILDVNDSFCRISGFSREEAIGHTSSELGLWVKPEDRQRMLKLLKKNGRINNEEFEFRNRKGEPGTHLFSAESITIDGEECTISIMTDITERKRAEEALRQSETKYSTLVENSNDGIVIIENGILRFSNTKIIEMTGFTLEEALGRNFTDFVIPEERPMLMEMYMKKVAGEEIPPNYEVTIVGHDGRHIITEINSSLITYEGRPAVMVIIREITERKQAEAALRESEEKFSKAFHAMPEAVTISRLKDGVFIDVNENFCLDNGCTREEAIGQTGEDLNLLIGPSYRDQVIKLAKERGRVTNIEFETKNKSGETRTALVSADVINIGGEPCLLSIRSDITERKKMEKALKESEEKFSVAFHSNPRMISIARVKDGKFIEVNDSYIKATGYSREEIIGHDVNEISMFVNPEESGKMAKLLKEQGKIANEEYAFRMKSGEMRQWLYSAEMINIGSEPCVISVAADITERKKKEELQIAENHVLTLLGQGAELNELLDAIVYLCEKNDPSIKGSVMLYDSSKNWLSGSSPSLPKEYNDVLKIGLPVGPNMGSCGTAAYYKKRVVIPDIKKSPLFKPHKESVALTAKYGLLAVWSEPIISSNGELLGTIANYSDHVGKPTADNLTILEWSAKIAAIAIERKRMEEALQESEEKFSKAFLAIPEAVSISRLKDGTFIDVNEGFCHDNECSREEIIGHTGKGIIYWVHPGQRKKIMKMVKEQGRIQNIECEFRKKSGEIHTVLFSADAVNIGNESYMLSITSDITERKRMEQTLRESEEKFSKAFHAIPDSVYITRIKDGIFIDANEGFCRNVGRTIDDVIGYRLEEIRPWATAEEIKKIQHLQDLGHFENEEIEIQAKSGEKRTLLMSGDTINIGGEPCMLLIGNDITNRKKMEQSLRESEEKFSKAFHAIPEAVSIERKKDGIFTDVNEGFCRNVGRTIDEVIGHHIEEIIPWENPDKFNKIHHIRDKGHFENEELEITVKSGEKRTLLLSGHNINISGEPCRLLIGNDITKRKQMEQALRESEEKFFKAFYAFPDAVSIASLKGGVFLEVNDNFITLNGYTREEIIGHTAKELNIWINPEDRYRIKKLIEERGRFDNEEFILRRKSGEIRTALLAGEIINIGGEPCIMTIGKDITEQKMMEQALRESEEKFSKAFHAIPESVSISRKKDRIFIDANESFCRRVGRTIEEVIGHHIDEIRPWATAKEMDKIQQLRNMGQFQNKEIEIHTRSGEKRTVLMSGDTINIGGEPCTLLISNDISERKRIENELKESEEKFSKAFQASPTAIVISDIEKGTILEANETFLQNTGYTNKEIIGKKSSGLETWAMPEERAKMANILKEKGHVSNKEYHFRTKSGEIRTWLFSADTISIKNKQYMLSVTTDITERKKIEQALRESEEKFSKAFHAIPDTISITSLKDGKFIDVNDSFLKLNRLTREQTIGSTANELAFLGKRDKRNKLRNLVQEYGRFKNAEIEFKAKSGKILTFLFSADTINIGGDPCLLIVGNDITKRKHAEEKLQKAMADLEQSSAQLQATNKELESFSYSVSHDLRSPLRSIDGFSQALLEDYTSQLDETGQDYLNRLRNASQKMGELIDGLLKLSRLTRSEMHPEKVDLSSLANEISSRLKETFANRDIEFIIDEKLTVSGDPQLLRVLLENLLSNAVKFTKNTKKAQIEFGSKNDGEIKTFFIKDNGAGFDMAFKDKLFGAFQRLHDAAEFPGTGIGLATVQRIINRHGGSINAEGAIGEGATFYFTLN
jgi:PAS domain S-box-containing protein